MAIDNPRMARAIAEYKAARDAARKRAEREQLMAETEQDLKFGESAGKGAEMGGSLAGPVGAGWGAIIGGAIGLGKAVAARKKRGQSTWGAIKGTAKDATPFTENWWDRANPSLGTIMRGLGSSGIAKMGADYARGGSSGAEAGSYEQREEYDLGARPGEKFQSYRARAQREPSAYTKRTSKIPNY